MWLFVPDLGGDDLSWDQLVLPFDKVIVWRMALSDHRRVESSLIRLIRHSLVMWLLGFTLTQNDVWSGFIRSVDLVFVEGN